MWGTAEKRFVPHVCLRNPFPLFLVWIPSIQSLPEAWGSSWEPQHAPPALRYGCIIPIPSLQLRKKPVICRVTEGVVADLWSPRFVTIHWLCSQLCSETAANQWTFVEIEILATWTCGCQPFSCPCSQNVTLPKRDLPFRSLRFLRAAAGSTSSVLCLHYACKRSHPFVQDSGFLSHVERHRFGQGVVSGLQGLLRNIGTCFFPFAMLLQWVEIELSATVGWKCGFQPFICQCSQNVTLPKGDFFDMLV